jgi:hypothetical protein
VSLSLNITMLREPGQVVVTGEVTRDGEPVPIDWPVIVVNPPELVPDEAGDVPVARVDPVLGEVVVMHRRDPDEAIRETIRHLAEQAG